MASWLVCSFPDRAVWVRALARDIVSCIYSVNTSGQSGDLLNDDIASCDATARGRGAMAGS